MAEKKKRIKIKACFGKTAAILVAVFAVLLTLDLVLKFCEEEYKWDFNVIPGLIYVKYGSRNTGAAFSFLADTEWGRIFFIVLTFLMLGVMIFFFVVLPERFAILKTALVMVAAGALGNLVDRLAFAYVRDFVWMNIFGSWACCNFADFYIVLGVILAVIDMLFLNEWAVLPLTKRAKAAQKQRAESEAKAEEKEIMPQNGGEQPSPQDQAAEIEPEDGGETEDREGGEE